MIIIIIVIKPGLYKLAYAASPFSFVPTFRLV